MMPAPAPTSPAARTRPDQRSSAPVSRPATPWSIARPTRAGVIASDPIQSTPKVAPSAIVPSCPLATQSRKRVGDRRLGTPGSVRGSSRMPRPYGVRRRRESEFRRVLEAGAPARRCHLSLAGITAAVTLDRSGPFALQGAQAAAGLEHWADEAGVRLVAVDDRGSRAAAIEAYATWVQQGVELLLGPYSSGLVRAVAPAVCGAGRLLWNHGGSADDLARPGLASPPAPACWPPAASRRTWRSSAACAPGRGRRRCSPPWRRGCPPSVSSSATRRRACSARRSGGPARGGRRSGRQGRTSPPATGAAAAASPRT